ncbi:MAG: CoA transferase subunit A [Chloroflexota bacterium]
MQMMRLGEAASLVEDRMTVAFGGMTLYRRPVAFALALLRREHRPRELTLLNFTAGIESDLLVGGGLVGAARTVYFGLEAFGLAPMYTQAAQQGRVRVVEETEASIAWGLRARTAGVGFMPSTAWVGTDLPRLRPDVRTVMDPYSGELLTAFPALHVDIAVLHGLAADRSGNVVLNNNLGIDLELVYAADLVICTVEALVDRVEKSAETTIVPAPGAHVIVPVPRGAWPTSCHPLYPVDGEEMLRYIDACGAAGDGQFERYVASLLDRTGVSFL